MPFVVGGFVVDPGGHEVKIQAVADETSGQWIMVPFAEQDPVPQVGMHVLMSCRFGAVGERVMRGDGFLFAFNDDSWDPCFILELVVDEHVCLVLAGALFAWFSVGVAQHFKRIGKLLARLDAHRRSLEGHRLHPLLQFLNERVDPLSFTRHSTLLLLWLLFSSSMCFWLSWPRVLHGCERGVRRRVRRVGPAGPTRLGTLSRGWIGPVASATIPLRLNRSPPTCRLRHS
ncbi:hypothetical protein-putative transmembrane protein [Rhodopirellula baltica SH 1]|uniref:Uncharacterized protein n=1 Tax=Rhodopirellula baltica (strain DSM 10527 / NCIMB 13988 / SH1) TaxID=243090 RepID=Q7UK99_RHOBA|nr:hypothetical protein-putative transmembrane protein [Rhodopirellula baltica SH 1]